MGRLLMVFGLLLFLAGAAVHLGWRLPPLGRLPGDFVYQKGGTTIYFPLLTSLLASLLLTGLLWLLRKL